MQLVSAPAQKAQVQAPAEPTRVATAMGAGPAPVAPAGGVSGAEDDSGIDSDLQARLDNLRKM